MAVGLATATLELQHGVPLPALDAVLFGQEILAYGELDARLVRQLEARGGRLTRSVRPLEALRLLRWRRFDAVLVAPDAPSAMDLVRGVKLGASCEFAPATDVLPAASQQWATPLYVLPFEGDTQYALIVLAPDLAFLETTDNLPLIDAITRLDVDRLRRLVQQASRDDPS